MKNFKNYLVVLVLLFCFSCGYSAHLKVIPTRDEAFERVGVSPSKPVAYFNSFHLKSRDIAVNPDASLENRVINDLKASGLFSKITKEFPENSRKFTLNLSITETTDDYKLLESVESFAINFTAFLISPFMYLIYDFESNMKLEVVRWDGKVKTYYANSKGRSRYHYFSNYKEAKQKIESIATDTNINSLINQMLEDKEFFAGN